MENFFRRLNELIDKEAGGKHTKFAKKAGIPVSTFQSYLSERIPKPEHLIRISETFNASIDWLLTGKGNVYLNDKTTVASVETFDDDPVISELLKGARTVLKSGNTVAFDALERNIRYFSLAIETEKRLEKLESRMSQIETNKATTGDRIREGDQPGRKEELIKKRAI